MVIAKIVGYAVHVTGSYFIPFLIAATVYLAALALMHIIEPRLQPH